MAAIEEGPPTRTPARPRLRLPEHLPALDGVRGLAILVVVMHMLNLLVAPPDRAGRLFSSLLSYGWMGVELFFALSGFLITGILLDTRAVPGHLSRFYARRFLRIFPLYYGTLFAAFVVLPALGAAPAAIEHDRPHQLWLWAYLSNWVAPTGVGTQAFHHFWSLSVEEQFYVLWPLALLGAGPRGCLRLCLAVALAALLARVALLGAGVSTGAVYVFTVTRMDALALGGAAAAVLRIPEIGPRLAAKTRPLWVGAAVTFGGGILFGRYDLNTTVASSIGYTFLAAACALVVLAAAAAELRPHPRSLLRAPPLRALGKYSYAVYVLHKPLHDFVGKPALARLGLDASRSTFTASVYIAAGFAASFVAAYASYHLYEKHFLRLKTRLRPRLAQVFPLK
jgi:peptidoglycan/LPS O-acetylase OafA/YrhL